MLKTLNNKVKVMPELWCPSAGRQDYALGYEQINLLTNKRSNPQCERKLKLGSSHVLLPDPLITHSGHRTPINLLSHPVSCWTGC